MKNSECGIQTAIFQTPLGWVGVAASDLGIVQVVLPKQSKRAVERDLPEKCRSPRAAQGGSGQRRCSAGTTLANARKLLADYFSGRQVRFDLPLDLRAATVFQRSVWSACREIAAGRTRSYGWIAERIKRPRSARAVGQAMGANPVPIIIP